MSRKSEQRESGKHTRTRAIDRRGRWRCISVLGVIVALGLLSWELAPAQAAPFAYISLTIDGALDCTLPVESAVAIIATASNTVVATVPLGGPPTAFGQFVGMALPPVLIQGNYGTPGNFELVVPMASGGLTHYYRPSNPVGASVGPSAAFGSGQYEAVSS